MGLAQGEAAQGEAAQGEHGVLKRDPDPQRDPDRIVIPAAL